MAGRVDLYAILPTDFDAEPLRTYARDVLNEFIEGKARPSFDQTVQTWSGASKPDFQSDYRREGDDEIGEIVAEDDRIYRFVSEGTKVRYGTMTPGFVPKTQPGRIAAQAGRGGLSYVSIARPRPGIKARRFDRQIRIKLRRVFKRLAKRRMAQAKQETGHAY